MITINLLPQEYRRPEATPVARFVAIVAGAVLLTSGLGLYGVVHYSKLKDARDTREATELDFQNKKALQDISSSLADEIKAYETRRAAIQEVAANRILWSRKLDEFLDIIYNDDKRNEYYVWLTGLKASPSREASRGKPTAGGELHFSGFCGSTEFSKVAALRTKLRTDAFYSDFKYLSPPNWSVEAFNDGREPAAAGKFNFQLTLKPLDWRRAARKPN